MMLHQSNVIIHGESTALFLAFSAEYHVLLFCNLFWSVTLGALLHNSYNTTIWTYYVVLESPEVTGWYSELSLSIAESQIKDNMTLRCTKSHYLVQPVMGHIITWLDSQNKAQNKADMLMKGYGRWPNDHPGLAICFDIWHVAWCIGEPWEDWRAGLAA